MGGISGIYDPCGKVANLDTAVAAMASPISYRGPDGQGEWIDEKQRVALVHHRLDTTDSSQHGQQPMMSQTGRFVLCFDGEIYDDQQLADELKKLGYVFRGRSDTEVVVTAIEAWGLAATLARLNGTFAMVLWDREQNNLSLIRDRMGGRNLYYAKLGDSFCFSSELKGLRRHPRFSTDIDQESLAYYLDHGYIAAPHTIFSGVSKLSPGEVVSIMNNSLDLRSRAYWALQEVSDHHLGQTMPDNAVSYFKRSLTMAVEQRLHGGGDKAILLTDKPESWAVAAAAQSLSKAPITTVSVDYQGAPSPTADISARLRTSHKGLPIDDAAVRQTIEDWASAIDEPCAHPDIVQTLFGAQIAGETATTCLVGTGGDCLFDGSDAQFFATSEVLTQSSSSRKTSSESFLEDARHNRILLKQKFQLADQVLFTSERAFASISRNCRLPMIDHRVIEATWRIQGSKDPTDNLLVEATNAFLSGEPLPSPKTVGPAFHLWWEGPLKDWSSQLMAPQSLAHGLFKKAGVDNLWRKKNEPATAARLWPLLLFQAWMSEA